MAIDTWRQCALEGWEHRVWLAGVRAVISFPAP